MTGFKLTTQQVWVTTHSLEWCAVCFLPLIRYSDRVRSRNKSLVDPVAPAHVHSPFSVGIPVQALATRPPSSVRRAPRSRTCVKHASWISSTVCRPKSAIPRWPSRARLQRATSTANTMRKTWKTRHALLPCHCSGIFSTCLSRWQMAPRR